VTDVQRQRSPLTFTVVPKQEADRVRQAFSDTPAWKESVGKGDMLLMSGRPQWTPQDRQRTGLVLRTREHQMPDGSTKFYVWAIVSPVRPAEPTGVLTAVPEPEVESVTPVSLQDAADVLDNLS
jgi:hypothetical protein